MWKTPGSGSLTFADGMVYLYDEKGTMKLVKASVPVLKKRVSSKCLPVEKDHIGHIPWFVEDGCICVTMIRYLPMILPKNKLHKCIS